MITGDIFFGLALPINRFVYFVAQRTQERAHGRHRWAKQSVEPAPGPGLNSIQWQRREGDVLRYLAGLAVEELQMHALIRKLNDPSVHFFVVGQNDRELVVAIWSQDIRKLAQFLKPNRARRSHC